MGNTPPGGRVDESKLLLFIKETVHAPPHGSVVDGGGKRRGFR
jgi:hypothetical protein